MENLEQELGNFRFSRPPEWLKARAFAAAQEAVGREEKRRYVQRILWAAVAAGLALAAVGHYVADTLAPIMPRRPAAVHASPLGAYPFDPSEILRSDYAAGALKLRMQPGNAPEASVGAQGSADTSAPSETGEEGK